MTKNERIDSDEGRIEFCRFLEGTIETVWRFLVEDELRGQWLCRGNVEAFEGGKIEFKFDPNHFGQARPPGFLESEFNTEIEGVVTACSPPHLLAFTWPEDNGATTTEVAITLKSVEKGTLLHLVHKQLTNPDHLVGSAAGWHAHLEQLECRLSRQLSPNFWLRHKEMDAKYRKQFDAPLTVNEYPRTIINKAAKDAAEENAMTQRWKTGRGKMGFMHPLLGKWKAVDPETPMGKVVCIRTYEKILNGKYIQLTADWDIGDGKKTYQEIGLYGLTKEKVPAFWSFTSDGGQSMGVLADVDGMHPQAKGFEADMPAGLARFGFWPSDTGMIWAAEAQTKKGWKSMIHHQCRRIE